MANWNQRILIGKVNKNLTDFVNKRIDRSTPLGNPYVMHREEQRQEVCESFRVYLNNVIKEQDNEPLLEALQELYDLLVAGHNINLQCWCMPNSCHGESIKAVLIEALETQGINP